MPETTLTTERFAQIIEDRVNAYGTKNSAFDPLDCFFFGGKNLPGVFFKIECRLDDTNVILEPEDLKAHHRTIQKQQKKQYLPPLKFQSKNPSAISTQLPRSNTYRLHTFSSDGAGNEAKYDSKFGTSAEIAFADPSWLWKDRDNLSGFTKMNIGIVAGEDSPKLRLCLETLEQVRQALATSGLFAIPGGEDKPIGGSLRRERPQSSQIAYIARLHLVLEGEHAVLPGIASLSARQHYPGSSAEERRLSPSYRDNGVSIPIQGNLGPTDLFLGLSGQRMMKCVIDFSGIRALAVAAARYFFVDVRLRDTLSVVAVKNMGSLLAASDELELDEDLQKFMQRRGVTSRARLEDVDEEDTGSTFSALSTRMEKFNLE